MLAAQPYLASTSNKPILAGCPGSDSVLDHESPLRLEINVHSHRIHLTDSRRSKIGRWSAINTIYFIH